MFGTAVHKHVKVSRQYQVRVAGERHPKRIDFRIGGSNPTVLEFAVRPPRGVQELCGPQNRGELIKLSKIPPTKARRRILLLVDLKDEPLDKDYLKSTYDPLNAGRGNKQRHPVTVVYVHGGKKPYSFTWKPRKRRWQLGPRPRS